MSNPVPAPWRSRLPLDDLTAMHPTAPSTTPDVPLVEPGPRPLVHRAGSHAWLWGLGATLLLALITLLGFALRQGPPPESPGAEATSSVVVTTDRTVEFEGAEHVSDETLRQIEELIASLEPIEETVTSDIHDRWFIHQQKLMKRLEVSGDRELGRAAIQEYARYGGDVSLVRWGLLAVAAFTAPDDSRDLLKTLMLTYGFPIDDRTFAATLLAKSSPDLYLEVALPFVKRRARADATMPNDEFLVRGWVTACEGLGISPVDVLADVTTNLWMEEAARHYAAKTLGRYPDDPLGRLALETALVESLGNGYLRRMAAQALRDSLPREDACTLFEEVWIREADSNFQLFMKSMIEDNCR